MSGNPNASSTPKDRSNLRPESSSSSAYPHPSTFLILNVEISTNPKAETAMAFAIERNGEYKDYIDNEFDFNTNI